MSKLRAKGKGSVMLGIQAVHSPHRIKTLVIRNKVMHAVLLEDGREFEGIVEGKVAGIPSRGMVRLMLTLEYPIDKVRLDMDAESMASSRPAEEAVQAPHRPLLDARGNPIGAT